MTLAKVIAGTGDVVAERDASDRRWCSDRRLVERRTLALAVAVDRRLSEERRTTGNRRRGFDRRGNVPIKTLWFHTCSQGVGDHRQCGQPAILRSPLGWRCFWHLDRRSERRLS